MKVRLENFQSILDDTYELDREKLNVIIAPNGTGKSVLGKAFDITALPWKYSSQIRETSVISYLSNKGYARVTYFVGEENQVRVTVKKTSVTYEYKDKVWEQNNCPQEVLQALGFVVIDDCILNIIDKDNLVPFVSFKPQDNAKLVKEFVIHPELEELIEFTEETLKLIFDKKKEASSLYNYAKSLYESINYVDTSRIEKEYLHKERILEELIKLEPFSKELEVLEFRHKKIEPERPTGVKEMVSLLERGFKAIPNKSQLGYPNLMTYISLLMFSPKSRKLARPVSMPKGIDTCLVLLGAKFKGEVKEIKSVPPNVGGMLQLIKLEYKSEAHINSPTEVKKLIEFMKASEDLMLKRAKESEAKIKLGEFKHCPTCGRAD